MAVTDGAGTLQISQYTLAGQVVRRLTTGPANHNFPSLSPDGRHLVFTGDETGRSEVYRRDLAAGSPAAQLTQPPVTATSPGWSPNGASIVYSALLPGAPAYQIFAARADGSDPVQLTATTDSGNTQPAVSSDGAHIAYISGRVENVTGAGGSSVTMFVNRIWVMNFDGSNRHALTAGPRDAYPQWLDARTVVFAREDVVRETSAIVSVDLEGAGERILSPAALRFIEPRPLPDAKSYGATIEEAGGLHLVRVSRADGSSLRGSGENDFKVERLHVPATDGSAFTLAWVLSAAAPARSSPAMLGAVLAIAVVAAALIAAFGVAAHRKTSAC